MATQNIMDDNCVSLATLHMNTACAPYYVTVEAYNKTIVFNKSITEIQGYCNDIMPNALDNSFPIVNVHCLIHFLLW